MTTRTQQSEPRMVRVTYNVTVPEMPEEDAMRVRAAMLDLLDTYEGVAVRANVDTARPRPVLPR